MEAKGSMSTTNEILDRHVATFVKQDMAECLPIAPRRR